MLRARGDANLAKNQKRTESAHVCVCVCVWSGFVNFTMVFYHYSPFFYSWKMIKKKSLIVIVFTPNLHFN